MPSAGIRSRIAALRASSTFLGATVQFGYLAKVKDDFPPRGDGPTTTSSSLVASSPDRDLPATVPSTSKQALGFKIILNQHQFDAAG